MAEVSACGIPPGSKCRLIFTGAALLVSVSIAEVERLWLRFQQMGCNDDGVLTPDVINTPALSADVFMKNVSFYFSFNIYVS